MTEKIKFVSTAFCACWLAAGCVSATEPTVTSFDDAGERAVKSENNDVGRTAYIDPETGELISKPSQEADKGLQSERAIEVAPAAPKVIEHDDGMVEVVLDGHMHSSLIAEIDCDGTVDTKHADSSHNEESQIDCKK